MESTQLIAGLLRDLQDPMMRMERSIAELTQKNEALTKKVEAQEDIISVLMQDQDNDMLLELDALNKRLLKQEKGLRSLAELYQLDLMIMRQENFCQVGQKLLHGRYSFQKSTWTGFDVFQLERTQFNLHIDRSCITPEGIVLSKDGSITFGSVIKSEWESKSEEEKDAYNRRAILCDKTNFSSQNARARELIASLDS